MHTPAVLSCASGIAVRPPSCRAPSRLSAKTRGQFARLGNLFFGPPARCSRPRPWRAAEMRSESSVRFVLGLQLGSRPPCAKRRLAGRGSCASGPVAAARLPAWQRRRSKVRWKLRRVVSGFMVVVGAVKNGPVADAGGSSEAFLQGEGAACVGDQNPWQCVGAWGLTVVDVALQRSPSGQCAAGSCLSGAPAFVALRPRSGSRAGAAAARGPRRRCGQATRRSPRNSVSRAWWRRRD
jgi:hypothetical protein